MKTDRSLFTEIIAVVIGYGVAAQAFDDSHPLVIRVFFLVLNIAFIWIFLVLRNQGTSGAFRASLWMLLLLVAYSIVNASNDLYDPLAVVAVPLGLILWVIGTELFDHL